MLQVIKHKLQHLYQINRRDDSSTLVLSKNLPFHQKVEKTQKLKLWLNSKTQILTKLKNSNSDKTQKKLFSQKTFITNTFLTKNFFYKPFFHHFFSSFLHEYLFFTKWKSQLRKYKKFPNDFFNLSFSPQNVVH